MGIAQAQEIAKEIKGDAEEFIKDLIDSTKAKVDEALWKAKMIAAIAEEQANYVLDSLKEDFAEAQAKGQEISEELIASAKEILKKGKIEGDRLKALAKEQLKKLQDLIKEELMGLIIKDGKINIKICFGE